MKFLLFTILIAVLTVINVGKSLQFSLAGDDWAALYHYRVRFDSFFSYFELSRYMGMYDFSFILMGTFEKLFGFNPFSYYFLSMTIRLACALSFYPAVLALTKDKKAAFLAGILFSFAYGGIESTNWVFNMATYISLGFFNLFLWQYFKNINKQNLKVILLETFLLFFSFYASPNRMAALLIIVPLLEIVTLPKINFGNFKRNGFLMTIIALFKSQGSRFIRVSLFLLPIIFFNLATATAWDKNYATMVPRLRVDNFNAIFYFFSNIGSALIPDRILLLFLPNLSVPDINNLGVFILRSFLVMASFIILIHLLSFSLFKKTFFLVSSYCLIFVYTLIFFLSLQGGHINQFGNLLNFLNALIGGYSFIVASLYLLSIRDTYPDLSRAGIFILLISLLFLVPPWLAFTGSYPSDHRYLLIPAASLMVFISIIASLFSRQKNKLLSRLSPLIIIVIILMNFLSLQSYFDHYLSNGRKSTYVDGLFATIHSNLKYPFNDKPPVFLFITDDAFKLYNSITFGFPYHMALTNKRFGLDVQKAPFAVDNFESLVDVVSSENSLELKRYGYKPVKIPVENVYFFKFEENSLTNITDEGRKLLIEKLPSLQ